MEEHDKPQFSSHPSNQSYAYGYPLTPVGPAGNYPITLPPQRSPARASHGQQEEYNRIDAYISTLFFIFIIFVLGFLSVIDSVNTHHPIKFRVDSFSVSHLNITNNQISGDWTIGISMENHNPHVKVLYEEFEASVFYTSADEFLSRGNVTSFIQGPRNQTLVEAKPVAWLEGLGNFVADSIAEDISLRGIVDFDIKLRVKAKYILRMDTDLEYVFDIVCKGVQVKFSSSSSTKNGTGAAVVIPELTQDIRQLPVSL